MSESLNRWWLLLGVTAAAIVGTGCAVEAQDPVDPELEPADQVQQPWDSQDGNPTHATHSYMVETAIDGLKSVYPELQTYRSYIVDGANRELHELPVSDAEQEALRIEIAGTNWGADHPEVLWSKARTAYAAGNKSKAYWYTGIIMHFVADMGAPAHAFHVVHQGTLSQKDNFEACALQKWDPLYSINRSDPGYAAPQDYIGFASTWTAADWQAAYGTKTYTLGFYPTLWFLQSSTQKTLLRNRQGRSTYATFWALKSAVTHWN